MKKLYKLVGNIILAPLRLFSKTSPFNMISSSVISKKSACLSGSRIYNSTIDDYSYVGRNCYLDSTSIGKYCSISDNCIIGMAGHPTDWASTSPIFHEGKNVLRINFVNKKYEARKHTCIGNDVWIGSNVMIKSGINIGSGAVLGAGAVITKDVQPYAIVGGNPAKVIRFRFPDETIKDLEEINWWNLPKRDIVECSDKIDSVEEFILNVRRLR